jgi:hypothetical protein
MRTLRTFLRGQLLCRLAGPCSGIHPRLAMTLLSDTKLWDEYGVNLRDVRSRVFMFLPL